MTTPIPQPPAIPFIGNINALDRDVPLRSFLLLWQKYGEIYQLNLLGKTVINVNTYELLNEVSDETRFKKSLVAGLLEVRNLVGDGLFTANNEEPNWAKAHRLLMPAFGPAAIRGMLEDMRDISDQMILKWERFGPETIIDPSDDFTRVALDSIAYCTMSYRMNSFYSETPPPFAQAMVDFLKESWVRSKRPSVIQAFMSSATAKYEQDQGIMRQVANKIIADRRAHPTDKKDMLNTMLYGRDPKTGEGLSDENISNNLLTFLIAGHETSSGMMTFAVYYLLKNPEAMRKLREEIDEVIGGRPIQYEDISKLLYLNAVMREALRLAPTAPGRAVAALEDTTIGGGKYFIKAGVPIILQAWAFHRDPLIWGEDANEFRPERMLDGKFEALPPNAWKPFGHGLRGCIGRAFAWQEIQLVLTTVIQRFDLSMADPSYTLDLKQALTVKPKDFLIRAAPRAGRPHLYATPSSALMRARDISGSSAPTALAAAPTKQPLYVLYGSNTGTSEGFAQRIVNDAPIYGFHPTIGTLDSAVGHVLKDGPVIIITASFEGQPAENAAHFVEWIQNMKGTELTGVRYAVFGCGSHEWAQTYQRIPKLCDDLLEQNGGRRLMSRGVGDSAEGNFFQVFDEFEANLWDVLSKEYESSRDKSSTSIFEVKEIDAGSERSSALRQPDAALGRVIENRILTKPGAPVKRHLELELPEGMTFQAGDYLAILPHNPPRDVHRVLAHFSLPEDQEIIISSDGPTPFPVGKNVALSSILSGYVELSQPATTRNLTTLIEAATSDTTRTILEGLNASYAEQVLAKRISILDLLEKHPDIKLPLSAFLRMLPPMRVRQYSISSSPLTQPDHVTLTVGVIAAPSAIHADQPFLGVASNYLANLIPGDRVQVTVRPSAVAFHPPSDLTVPIVMFCAGSGLAPMRGFIQERAAQKQAGRDVARMLLFFGCRAPGEDYLYSETDLKEWVGQGVLDVRPAFSRASQNSEGCGYVQDRIWHDRNDVIKAYRGNAKFFTCGSNPMANGVKQKLVEIIQNLDPSMDSAAAAAKFEGITKGRYTTDIFN